MPESHDLPVTARPEAEYGDPTSGRLMRLRGWLFQTRTLFAFALATLLIGSLAQRYLGSYGDANSSGDFYVYFCAAHVVHDHPHANLYDGATPENPQGRNAPANSEIFTHAKSAGFDNISFYIYPPLLADLL